MDNLDLLQMDINNSSLKESVSYICFVLKGVILPLGMVCCMLSFLVFVTSRALKRTSTGNYLMALSVADWTFLLADLIRWLNSASSTDELYLGFDFVFSNNVMCKLTYFIRYGSKLASAWITVAITTERFISVRWPLHAHQISTPTRAKVTITVIYLICFGLGAYPLWTLAVQPSRNSPDILICTMIPDRHYDVWNTAILAVGSLLLPGLLMCILTGLIIYSLIQSKHTRQQRLSCNSDSRAKNPSQNIEKQLTVILLSVAIAFILLRLPYTIVYSVNRWKSTIWHPPTADIIFRLYVSRSITEVIASANYTINFFLYCLCGSAFRRQLRTLGSCRTCPLANKENESRTYLMKVPTTSGSKNSSGPSKSIVATSTATPR